MRLSTSYVLLLGLALAALAAGCVVPQPVDIKPIPHSISKSTKAVAQAPPAPGATQASEAAKPHPARADYSKIEAAKARVAANPTSWSGYNDLGVAYYDKGMYDEAIAAFQQALAVHPISSVLDAEKRQKDAVQRQKDAMVRAQKAQQAQQESAAMSSLLSGLLGVVSVPGMNSLGQQTLAAMIPAMDSVSRAASMPDPSLMNMPELQGPSQLQPRRETALIYSNLGRAYYQKSNYQEAVTSFEKSIALAPSQVSLLEWTAHANYELSHYEKSIRALNRYMTLSNLQSPSGSYILLSRNFAALGMPGEADKAFRRAIAAYEQKLAADPPDRTVIAKMARAYLEHLDFQKAAGLLEGLVRDNPSDVPALGGLAVCYMALGRYDQALKTVQRKMKLDQHKPYDFYLLGRIYDETGKPSLARAAYAKLVEAYEASAEEHKMPVGGVAVAYASIGQQQRAIAMLEESMFLNPFGSTALYDFFKLGLVYEKSGRITEAIAALNSSAEINPRYVFATRALQRLAGKTASHRERLWLQAQHSLSKGSSAQAVDFLGKLYRLMPTGPEKEKLRLKMLALAAKPGGAPRLGLEAQRRFLRGNAALKSAKGPADLYRALYEYKWASYHSPWSANIYLSSSVVYGLLQKYRLSISYLRLYLAGTPQAANVDQVMSRLYEMEYQREKTLRSLSLSSKL